MINVTAAILRRQNEILIARRPIGDQLEKKWEFPGGKVEDGETPEKCLSRELQEELDIETAVGAHLISNEHHYDHCSICLMAYEVVLVNGTPAPGFHDKIKWVAIENLDNYDFAPADLPIVSFLLDDK